MSRTTVVIPEGLRDEAKELGVNISDVCRYALEGAVKTARYARKQGASGYKRVRFSMYPGLIEEDPIAESVQFLGRQVIYADPADEAWYLTPKGSIVRLVVYEDRTTVLGAS